MVLDKDTTILLCLNSGPTVIFRSYSYALSTEASEKGLTLMHNNWISIQLLSQSSSMMSGTEEFRGTTFSTQR